jgi:hypothetical protein
MDGVYFDRTRKRGYVSSPRGYFSTPTSTGDGLSLTDGSTSQFFQVSLHTIFNSETVNELRFHYGSDFHFDLPDTPPTGPAIVIQNPDTGFVYGGNRFQLSTATSSQVTSPTSSASTRSRSASILITTAIPITSSTLRRANVSSQVLLM